MSSPVREFKASDYAAYVAASNRCYPDYPWTVKEMRHQDDNFDHTRFFKTRLVAQEGGVLVGGLDLSHRPSRFHPDRYSLDFWVLPDKRRRGHGTALFDVALQILKDRNALAATVGVKESMADGVEFVRKRGFVEIKRDWESRLKVAGFDFAKFARADDRLLKAGIRIVTYADEAMRDADAERKAYEMIQTLRADVPATDPVTLETIDEWRVHWLNSPTFLADAFFIAIDPTGRWLGMSNLEKQLEDPSFMWQGLTAVHRDARGKGIAMALKLRTVTYAQAMKVDHIKTWNDQKNRPMLSINEAMGFEKQPAWMAMELKLRD
ncbi:MAG TPA: GNAT family N-acetyltransferase [Candidatus Limnocylindrales bacterium]|nr:GNAT family N-acetyltransferase [Candidatus Limnocylindrales bacterium]